MASLDFHRETSIMNIDNTNNTNNINNNTNNIVNNNTIMNMNNNINNINKLKKIYYGSNVWFGFKTTNEEKITINKRPFYIVQNNYNTLQNFKLNEVIGQFLSSTWFSKIFTIHSSIKFYVIAANKNYEKDTIEEIVNTCDDYNHKFICFDTFTLYRNSLCSYFNKMLINNEKVKRINIFSDQNKNHNLNIHLSIKHIRENNELPYADYSFEETFIIDTPTILYS